MDLQQIPSPCFVLDEAKLESNLQLIDRFQSAAGVEVILAFKGFALWKTFPLIREYLSGATASSLNEVRLCHEEMGVKAHTYCVAYRESEVQEIFQKSSHVTFNSITQFDRYKEQAQFHDVSCGIRINPEYSDVSTDLYNPSSPQSRLGMTSHVMPEELPAQIEGLHVHVLCESDVDALEQLLLALETKFEKYLKRAQWLNLGGGHLVSREGYGIDKAVELLSKFRKKHGVHIILEPGGAIAWETGVLKTKVLDIVDSGGVKTAIMDASFTCHMPDCLEMPYRPRIRDAFEDKNQGAFPYRIGGVSCLAGDFMEAYSFDQPLNIGDDLIFEDMMHYTMVKTTTFNGVHHPSIGIWTREGNFELVKEFGYPDFRNRLS